MKRDRAAEYFSGLRAHLEEYRSRYSEQNGEIAAALDRLQEIQSQHGTASTPEDRHQVHESLRCFIAWLEGL